MVKFMERKCRRVVAKVCGEGKNKNDFCPPKAIDLLWYLKTSLMMLVN